MVLYSGAVGVIALVSLGAALDDLAWRSRKRRVALVDGDVAAHTFAAEMQRGRAVAFAATEG